MRGRARGGRGRLAVVLALILIPSFRLNLEHPAFGLATRAARRTRTRPSP